MNSLTIEDLDFILESLKYSRLKFEDHPIGPNGYPSYEYKQTRIDQANAVAAKIKKLKEHASK